MIARHRNVPPPLRRESGRGTVSRAVPRLGVHGVTPPPASASNQNQLVVVQPRGLANAAPIRRVGAMTEAGFLEQPPRAPAASSVAQADDAGIS